jgi:hypothetical protein
MLGVAPSPPATTDRSTSSVPPAPIGSGFQPFAPVASALTTVLDPSASGQGPSRATSAEAPPQTLTGLVDPSKTLPLSAARSPIGFGAQSPGVAATPAVQPAMPDVNNLPGAPGMRAEDREQAVGARAFSMHGTLIGVSPMAPGREQSAGENPATKGQFHGTLLGVSPIVPADYAAAQAARVPDHAGTSDPHRPSSAPPPASPFAPGHKGTLLGVAMPGIAPLQPGQAKVAPAPIAPPATVPANPAPIVRQASVNPPRQEIDEQGLAARRTQRQRLAWVFGTAAVLLVVLIVVALGVWWTSVHLTVEVTTSESGTERLTINCSNCPDGSKATIDSKHATFKSHSAVIELARRLSIGQNQLTLNVVRPNRTRGETVNVTVPVEFRVTSSIAELAADPPAVSAQLETTPGSRFILEGQTYTVGPSGLLKVPVDVSSMLVGPASTVVPFERNLAYEVVLGNSSMKGTLVVRTGITPLEVATPGPAHVTQNATFTLSGRTTAQAKLTANGHVIAVAPDGTFRQEMALSAPGSTKLFVRAQEANLAPRLAEIALERVTNLKQRADELVRPLLSDFDAIVASAEKKPDTMVALRAEVVAIETVGALSRIVGTSNCSRGPCLSSVRYGGPLSLRRGNRFIAVGKARLTPRLNSTERDLAVEASLVVEDSDR